MTTVKDVLIYEALENDRKYREEKKKKHKGYPDIGYPTFEKFIKEIKKPRREYEKKYVVGKSGGFQINEKGKRREKYHDILMGIYVEQRKKDIVLFYLRIVYDNHSKICKIIEDQKKQCKDV